MTKRLDETLQIEGLSDLELAEIRKELAAVDISLEHISRVERPPLSKSTTFGDPGTVALIFEFGKFALPLVTGVLAGWLAKGRKRTKSWKFVLKKGDFEINVASSTELVENENTKATLNNFNHWLKQVKDEPK